MEIAHAHVTVELVFGTLVFVPTYSATYKVEKN
jgi:hypothetical protein